MRMSRKAVLKSGGKRLPIGTIWTITESGTFVVEETGKYTLELHGGGGGGAGGVYVPAIPPYQPAMSIGGGGGGGSGTTFTDVALTKGQVITVTIGAGGDGGTEGTYDYNPSYNYAIHTGKNGGTTTFGSYSVEGGKGGGAPGYPPESLVEGGSASGSIATNGATASGQTGGPGGYGNASNPSQLFGNGGNGGNATVSGTAGQPGAVILTLVSYS